MIDIDKVSDIFCLVDEFCKDFRQTTSAFILGKQPKRPLVVRKRGDNYMFVVSHERFSLLQTLLLVLRAEASES